ncbi:TPA: TraY domain-containing protein [Legionella feeleii]
MFLTIRISSEANKLLTEACERSGRKKIPEAKLRLEDHLNRFRSISEHYHTVDKKNI